MSRIRSFRFLLLAYIILILVMFLLPRYSAESYSILKNTASQLGAQNTPNAWVMNTVFCLLGAACMAEGWLHLKSYWFQKLLLSAFGLALIMVAFFQHAPISQGIPFSSWQDQVHSLMATTVGISFTVLAISGAFIAKSAWARVLAIGVACIATLMSLLMFNLPNWTGLFQRLMFITAFAWLIYFLERFRRVEE